MRTRFPIPGFARFNPRPLREVGFEQRAQSKTDGGVQVSVVALGEDEARAAMGVDLAQRGIQPVWVKVENRENIGFVVPPLVIDHEYFSPMEAAWQVHGWLSGATNARIDEHFRELRLPTWVEPGETASGFVFTNLDQGVKYVNIELLGGGAREVRRFDFLAAIPGFKADFQKLQGWNLYPEEEIQNLDETAFRAWLETLPSACSVVIARPLAIPSM